MEKTIKNAGVELRIYVVESHRSLGIGEILQEQLRQICKKVWLDLHPFNDPIILDILLRAVNDTIGKTGLSPQNLFWHKIHIPNHQNQGE